MGKTWPNYGDFCGEFWWMVCKIWKSWSMDDIENGLKKRLEKKFWCGNTFFSLMGLETVDIFWWNKWLSTWEILMDFTSGLERPEKCLDLDAFYKESWGFSSKPALILRYREFLQWTLGILLQFCRALGGWPWIVRCVLLNKPNKGRFDPKLILEDLVEDKNHRIQWIVTLDDGSRCLEPIGRSLETSLKFSWVFHLGHLGLSLKFWTPIPSDGFRHQIFDILKLPQLWITLPLELFAYCHISEA